MSSTAHFTVEYKDQLDPLEVNDSSGIEKTLIRKYILAHCPDYVRGDTVTLESPDDIHTFARLAAQLYPVHVTTEMPSVFDSETTHAIESESVDLYYVPLFLPTCRESRFTSLDTDAKTRYVYERYAALFNEGYAMFGARLQNIERLSFVYDH